MKKRLLLTFAMIASIAYGNAQDKTYYINSNTPANGGGDDTNDGLSPTTAWKTIAKANALALQAGDKVLLYSDGPYHNGSFSFDNNDQGTPQNPITISSYGPSATANVYADNDNGVYAGNTASIKIENLNFYGGRTYNVPNSGSGIYFYTDGGLSSRPYIFINNCRMEGFALNGILIQSYNGDNTQPKGFSDITIKNSIITNCGNSGITINAFGNDEAVYGNYVHSNVLIENVRARKNEGNLGTTTSATGNGIVVSSAENVLVDKCVTDENGASSNLANAGPSGILFYNVKNGIIQKSESFKNFAGLTGKDGNGFVLDGGSQNCFVQYSFSHDNAGAGFGLFEYGSPNAHSNNTVRYNLSQNDARGNGSGAIKVQSIVASNNITGASVYNNTVFLDAQNLTNNANLPVGINVTSNNLSNVKVSNNIFYLADATLAFTKTVDLLDQPINIIPTELLMANNLYYNASNTNNFAWGSNYSSLASWRTATNQEKFNSVDYGFATNPQLVSPGTAVQVAPIVADGANQPVGFGGDVSTVTQYKTNTGSPAIGGGIDLNTLFGISIGNRDFYNFSLATNAFDIGAHQSNTVLPLSSLKSFSLRQQINGNLLSWEMTETDKVISFNVEYSVDGKDFSSLGSSITATKSLNYNYLDASAFKPEVYYRLKGTDFNGVTWISKILAAKNNLNEESFSIFPVPLNNSSIIFNAKNSGAVIVTVTNMNGKVVFSRTVQASFGKNQVSIKELDQMPAGSYIVTVSGAGEKSFSKQVIR